MYDFNGCRAGFRFAEMQTVALWENTVYQCK